MFIKYILASALALASPLDQIEKARSYIETECYEEAGATLEAVHDLDYEPTLDLARCYLAEPYHIEETKVLLDLILMSSPRFYQGFDDNPLITPAMRALFAPYLIPQDHPLKPQLDALFSASRVTQNNASLKRAGFKILRDQPGSYVIIAKHPQFPRLIFKLYLDNEWRMKKNRPGYFWLTKRCEGVRLIKSFIESHNLKHFVTPEKWLYPLPAFPKAKGIVQQPVILIETDMELVSKKESKKAWKKVNKEILDELYILLSKGFGSTFLVGNIPYSKKGQFAFIDTEYPTRKISLKSVEKYFNSEMKHYWKGLIKK